MAEPSLTSPPTIEDRTWMQIALHEARKGVGLTSPNPPVGAVVVKDDHILGKGWHRKAGEPTRKSKLFPMPFPVTRQKS
jgi:hypothetical protein